MPNATCFRGNFSWIMAFGQARFQACIATIYLQTAALQWYIYQRLPVRGILADQQLLGAHTSIVMFHPDGEIICYKWSHPFNAPFGTPSLTQCVCLALRPWITPVEAVLPEDGSSALPYVELVCARCNHKLTYEQRENQEKMTEGGMPKDASCGWYYERITADMEFEP